MSGSCFEPGFHRGYTKAIIYIQHICGVYTCQLDGFGTAEVSFWTDFRSIQSIRGTKIQISGQIASGPHTTLFQGTHTVGEIL